jgi:hypothetical protein
MTAALFVCALSKHALLHCVHTNRASKALLLQLHELYSECRGEFTTIQKDDLDCMFLKVKKHYTEINTTTTVASNEVTANVSAAGGKATATSISNSSSSSSSTVAAAAAATVQSGDGGVRPDTAQQLQSEHVTLFSRYVLYNTYTMHTYSTG